MSSISDRQLLLSILDYLESKKVESSNPAFIDEASRMLQLGFSIDRTDSNVRSQYEINTDLFTIFNAYLDEHHLKKQETNPLADPSSNPELKSFLDNLNARGYFSGVQEGSSEYNERYEKAVKKYLDRKGQSTAQSAPQDTEALYKAADEYKQKGNDFFRSGDYANAIENYTKAFNMSKSNPQNHIYLCNRATSHFYMKNYEDAEKDCKECIALNASYIKAYIRLANVYNKQGRWADVLRICEDGLAVDANASELQALKASAETRMEGGAAQPDMGSMFANLASDPSVRNAAENLRNGNANLQDLLNNPAINQMAQSVMSNPEMMNNIMSSMGSLFGGASGGNGGNGGMDPNAFANLARMFGGNGQGGNNGAGSQSN